MASMILGFSLTLIVQQRRQFQIDQARGILNQNLRGAMDYLTSDIRQGGEQLAGTSTSPPRAASFSIIDGASGAPDTVSVQRKVIPEELVLSTAIVAGTNVVAQVGSTSGSQSAWQQWQNYRQTDPATSTARSPDQVVAYILDPAATATTAARRGEFFVFTGNTSVTNAGITTYQITRSGNWANAYGVGSLLYILEERTFNLVTDSSVPETFILQMQRDRGISVANPNGGATPRPIANALQNFQVQGIFPTATVNSLNSDGFYVASNTNPDWRTMRSINITLTAAPPRINSLLSSAERTRFFGDFSLISQILPRNVISLQ